MHRGTPHTDCSPSWDAGPDPDGQAYAGGDGKKHRHLHPDGPMCKHMEALLSAHSDTPALLWGKGVVCGWRNDSLDGRTNQEPHMGYSLVVQLGP